jgi:putative DNA primase/helicase
MSGFCLDVSKGKPFPDNEGSQISDAELYDQVRTKLIDNGLIVPAGRIDDSGEICRVGYDKKPSSKHAYYVFYPESGTVLGGIWSTGHKFKYTFHRGSLRHDFHTIKPKRYSQNKDKLSKNKAELQRIWTLSQPTTSHPYAVKKQIKTYLARLLYHRLVIPLLQIDGALSGIQFIDVSSKKRFQKDSVTKSSFCPIGMTTDPVPILLCEGYATGCSLHEATNLPTIVTFSSGNLPVVAKQLHHKFPERHIVICADNDHVQEAIDGVNAGLKAAMEAHQIAGGTICIPQFPLGDTGSDFNDIHVKYGLDFVRKLLSSVINKEC